MATYQVWLLNSDYSKRALLANTGQNRTWERLYYRQVLENIGACTIDMVPNSDKIDDIAAGRRILIVRNGTIVYGGIIVRHGWDIGENAPADETYTVNVLDHAIYADWRIVEPGSGDSHDERTGAADDIAKEYVYYHAGAGAGAGRPFSDLSVEADATAAGSITVQSRYDKLITVLQKIARHGDINWRFAPTTSGCEFQTKYQKWGTDRTKGNGSSDEVVFTADRKNVLGMSYALDTSEHYNYAYVGGQGEEEDRTIVERSDATAISNYGRRERFVDARDLSVTSSLQDRGDAWLVEHEVLEALSCKPKPGGWKSDWDLGDHVTVQADRYGRTFTQDAEIYAVAVEIFANGVEHVTPEMRAV